MPAPSRRIEEIAADELFTLCGEGSAAADGLLGRARQSGRDMVATDGAIDPALIEAEQFAVHGLAWLATYNEALRQCLSWAEQLQGDGNFGDLEQLLLRMGYGGYLTEMANGIQMSQIEVVRPADMGLTANDVAAFRTAAVERLIATGNTQGTRDRLAGMLADAASGG